MKSSIGVPYPPPLPISQSYQFCNEQITSIASRTILQNSLKCSRKELFPLNKIEGYRFPRYLLIEQNLITNNLVFVPPQGSHTFSEPLPLRTIFFCISSIFLSKPDLCFLDLLWTFYLPYTLLLDTDVYHWTVGCFLRPSR